MTNVHSAICVYFGLLSIDVIEKDTAKDACINYCTFLTAKVAVQQAIRSICLFVCDKVEILLLKGS